MNLQEMRVQVLEKLLEDTIRDGVAMEIGLEIKQSMSLQYATNPEMIKKIDQAIAIEKAELQNNPKVIDIISRKLVEAKEKLNGSKS